MEARHLLPCPACSVGAVARAARHAARARRRCSPPSSSSVALAEKEQTGRRLGEIVVDARLGRRRRPRAGCSPSSTASSTSTSTQREIDRGCVGAPPEKLARRYARAADPLPRRRRRAGRGRRPDERRRLRRPPARARLNVRVAVAGGPDLERGDRARLPRPRSRSLEPLGRRATRRREIDDIRGGAATTAPAIKLVNSLIAPRDRRGRVRHPLRAAGEASSSSAPASTASCASSTTIPEVAAAGRDEPPEDHGRARHRRAARAAGRPHRRSASAASRWTSASPSCRRRTASRSCCASCTAPAAGSGSASSA